MLRRAVIAVGVALALIIVTGSFVAPAANAEGGQICTPTGWCYTVAATPGGGAVVTPVGGGGAAVCMWKGRAVACVEPGVGTWGGDGCYYAPTLLDIPAGHPFWEGHQPGDGALYDQSCLGRLGLGLGGIAVVWRASPPAPPVAPIVVAMKAINAMQLRGPTIGIVPKPGSQGGLVGLPVWMWTTVAPDTWGPITRTASVPGVSVTATARAQKIVWAMGDGSQVVCTHPGSPYKQSYGNRQSPDCGHVYGAPADYTVTGTTYWEVTWAGAGQSGQIPLQLSSSTQITIGELQVLIQ